MKIIWHRISIQTPLFQACLPTRQNGVENRDKAYAQLDISAEVKSSLVRQGGPFSTWPVSIEALRNKYVQ